MINIARLGDVYLIVAYFDYLTRPIMLSYGRGGWPNRHRTFIVAEKA